MARAGPDRPMALVAPMPLKAARVDPQKTVSMTTTRKTLLLARSGSSA